MNLTLGSVVPLAMFYWSTENNGKFCSHIKWQIQKKTDGNENELEEI